MKQTEGDKVQAVKTTAKGSHQWEAGNCAHTVLWQSSNVAAMARKGRREVAEEKKVTSEGTERA